MGKSGNAETKDTVDDQTTTAFLESLPSVTGESLGTTTTTMPSYRRLKPKSWLYLIFRLIRTLLVRFVGLCSTFGLISLLFYWFYEDLTFLVLLHVAVLGILYNVQDKLLYYPEQPPQSHLYVESPSNFGLPYENVVIRTQDGVQIQMFFIRQPPDRLSNAPTVIYFHGNAGNIGHRLANTHGLFHYCNANILLVEYRGYGKSHGCPCETGLYLDAEAALDYIFTRSDINQQKLVVFGRSLGGAVAIRTCSVPYYATRIACLVVENTFTSIPEMAYTLFEFRFLQYIPECCYKNKFLSRYCIDKVEKPSLFICGLKDNLVPPKMMLQLYNISGSRLKRMAVFQDGTHNETWQCQGYYDAINHFLTEVEQFSLGKSLARDGNYSTDESFQTGEQEF